MREVHKISLIALGYAVVLSLVTYIFFKENVVWAMLGSLTAMFNHSQIIRVTKGRYTTQKLIAHLMTRYLMYVIIIAFVWFDTKGYDESVMKTAFIFLLLGFVSIKVGVLIYATPLIKKTDESKEIIENENSD